ncbi:PAS domain-containing protein [Marinobacterium sediminicola]|uniref:histidine kinase n=1 Tax=Marinobacterium sediminicola TaxID=518898 RepID=A0ABY1S146_9GAMM|nr:PAS domain S-box protein [Marinobacterium sediminicola]ULG69783.1 PAS domain S-box protein [Marinobacterium sediminicola]SMR75406.1 PAS domain S-box-containing protein [Marinobacterium sediminicola]
MIDMIRPDAGSSRFEYEWERQYAALNHHAIVSITDAQGRITYVNDLFCEISGYNREELLGKTHSLVKSDVHDPAFYQDMWRTITSGQLWKGEVCNRRKDGSFYWVESTITPFMDDQGKPYQFVSIRTDITRMKEHERELIAARNEAERANRAKSQFLSSMSHELRTPMNAILGFGQLMEYDNDLPTEHKESVHEILKAGRHLLDLINEILDLAKVEAGHLTL